MRKKSQRQWEDELLYLVDNDYKTRRWLVELHRVLSRSTWHRLISLLQNWTFDFPKSEVVVWYIESEGSIEEFNKVLLNAHRKKA